MFLDFDEYLKLSFSPDYWYDVGIEYASAIVEKFQSADWQELTSAMYNRSAEWRVKCAESIDVSQNEDATRILLNLLSASEDDVVIAAVDSLRSRESLKSIISEEEIVRVREIMSVGSPPVKKVLEDFLNKFNQ